MGIHSFKLFDEGQTRCPITAPLPRRLIISPLLDLIMEEIYALRNSGVVVNGGLMYINRSGESIMGLNHQREVRACGQTEAQAIYPCCPSSPTNAWRKGNGEGGERVRESQKKREQPRESEWAIERGLYQLLQRIYMRAQSARGIFLFFPPSFI